MPKETAMTKQEVIELLESMPDRIDPERLMEMLYLKAKLERSEAAAARGELLSQEELEAESDKWFE
jgi:hypothetical protein